MELRIRGGGRLQFGQKVVDLNSMQQDQSKDNSIQNQRTLLETMTDCMGLTNHQDVIGVFFDMVNSRDSREFQIGILNLVNLLHGADQNRLIESLGFKVTNAHFENNTSHIILSFNKTEVMSIELDGEFHFWSHFVKQSEEGHYKLTGHDLMIPSGNQCLEINAVHKITVNQHLSKAAEKTDFYLEASGMLIDVIF